MTQIGGVLGLQVESMLTAIQRQRDERCREIVATAEQRANQALAESRRRLFRRQRRAVAEERERRRHELHVAASRRETLARERAYARYRRVLEDAWPRLVAALESRWMDAGTRRAWCDMVVAEGIDVLGSADWLVEHPEAWPAAERDRVKARLAEHGLAAPVFRGDAGIRAGLRVRADTACLDGTSEGLLSRREEIEALLLAMWERQRPGAARNG